MIRGGPTAPREESLRARRGFAARPAPKLAPLRTAAIIPQFAASALPATSTSTATDSALPSPQANASSFLAMGLDFQGAHSHHV